MPRLVSGGLYTNLEHRNVNCPPIESPKNVLNSLEPGAVKVLSKGDPGAHEKIKRQKCVCKILTTLKPRTR